MVNKLKSAFGNPFNWFAFILLAILLRGLLWAYFGHLVHIHLSGNEVIENYFVKDDYIYFFHPVDNYFSTGHYAYLTGVPFTGRMPGYAVVYFLARLIFSQQIALWAVIILQFILSAISVYLLALIAYYSFNNSKRSFYITYGLYILAVFPGFFDFFIIAESFSVSALIFSLYNLVRYFKIDAKPKYLVLSGLFLTWTIFLREYTGVLIILFPVVLAYYFLKKKESFTRAIWHLILFCLPFGICETAWVARNYSLTHKIILLTTPEEEAYDKLYSAPWESLDNLVYTWGENASPFDKTAPGYYYRYPKEAAIYKFPQRIFNGVHTYNRDSLVSLRKLYAIYFYTNDTSIANPIGKMIVAKCEEYRKDYIAHNFFYYWFIKPIKDIKYLVVFSGTGYLPLPPFSQCSVAGKLIKIFFCILYYIILISAMFGIFTYFFIRRQISVLPLLYLLIVVFVVGTLIFIGSVAAYSSIQEPRYFVHCFALLVIFSSYFLGLIIPQKRRSPGIKEGY